MHDSKVLGMYVDVTVQSTDGGLLAGCCSLLIRSRFLGDLVLTRAEGYMEIPGLLSVTAGYSMFQWTGHQRLHCCGQPNLVSSCSCP